jgi:trimeric autotransporter adhesin
MALLNGDVGNNLLNGGVDNDTLNGMDGNDTLNGGVGNDILNGGVGNDTMMGGVGSDRYTVDSVDDKIEENPDQGTDSVTSTVDWTLADNVENLTLTGTAIKGTGNSLNNTIAGNAGNNSLDGGEGNDILNGGLGNDTMMGGAGNDRYTVDSVDDKIEENPDEGTDSVSSAVDWTLTKNLENLTLSGTAIKGTGNSLNNTITGNALDNSIDGGAGNDNLNGGAGNDTVIGGEGNDSFNGSTGDDSLVGGAGSDRYTVDSIGDVIVENLDEGTDSVISTVNWILSDNVENLTLTGTTAITGKGNSLDNNIYGNALNNSFEGGAGNDSLNGGAGDDSLVGGTGNDRYTVDTLGDLIVENLNEGIDTVLSYLDWTLGANLENLSLANTIINGTGNSLDNSISGNAGNNRLDGGAGNDTLKGRVGNDTLIGGVGDDTYIVDSLEDMIEENPNEGNDTVMSSIDWTLGVTIENLILTDTAINGIGNDFDNSLTGNAGNNSLEGGIGNDTLNGGEENDILNGGLGDDTYIVDSIDDMIEENANEGNDTVISSIDWTLDVTLENLILTDAAINGIGNDFDNSLTGNAGNNSLEGGVGNDTLNGGEENDTLNGGDGDDTYIVDSLDDMIEENANEGNDTVISAIDWTLGDNLENLILSDTAINGTGNSLDNRITGNAGNNTLSGGDGNDTLDGTTGNDTLIGGAGNDMYIVDSASDAIAEIANQGTDTVQTAINWTLASHVENLILTGNTNLNGTGNTLDNTITGNNGNNILNGGSGHDTIDGGVGADTLDGGNGNDYLDGGLGADSLTANGGNDIYVVDNIGDQITEDANGGTDTVRASIIWTLAANVENLVLTGIDAINGTGNSANNTIVGNLGENILNGDAGNDTLIGGAGNDMYIVDSATDVIAENANEGTDTVQTAINWTLASHVENLILTGNTDINGTGNTLDNTITGNSGNNMLNGGVGNDTLDGGLGNDTLDGGTGNDTLDGGVGADSLIGGSSNDTYVVDNIGDQVTEGTNAGTDTVSASITWTLAANLENLVLTGTDAIDGTGNSSNNTITGNSGDNILSGLNGNDTLIGGLGTDILIGGLGNDTYLMDSNSDTITEDANAGTDLVRASINWTLVANLENLILTGSDAINGTGTTLNNSMTGNTADNTLSGLDGNDTINGDAGNDSLDGGIGNDNLNAGDGNDMLVGGAGVDTLTGGIGNDVFMFSSMTEASDTITDFTVSDDVMNLTSLFQTIGVVTDFSNAIANGYLQLGSSGANTLVRIDTDGGANSFTTLATLTGVTAGNLTSTNFLF